MSQEDLSYSLQAQSASSVLAQTVRGVDPLLQVCCEYTLEQLLKRFYTRVAPTHPLPPSQHTSTRRSSPGTSQPSASTPHRHRLLPVVCRVSRRQLQGPSARVAPFFWMKKRQRQLKPIAIVFHIAIHTSPFPRRIKLAASFLIDTPQFNRIAAASGLVSPFPCVR